MAVATIDLTDGDVWAGDPFGAIAALRAAGPIHRNPAPDGGWYHALLSYKDVDYCGRNPHLFSAAAKGFLIVDEAEGHEGFRPLIGMDPPEHTHLRALINRDFTPRRIAQLETRIRDIAGTALDRFAPDGKADIVAGIATELPLTVIGELLGVPAPDRHRLIELSDAAATPADPSSGRVASEESIAATWELVSYFNELSNQKREHPEDDLLSALVRAEVGGEALNPLELLGFCVLLAIAGNETTRTVTSGGLLALLQHRDQFDLLRNDRSLMPRAVEEMLRFVSPVAQFRRTAMEDVELSDTQICAGDRVVMCFPAANRDPAVFTDPDRFDITRDPNHHVAFGTGPHFCLGASLARLQLKIVFNEILDRFPDLELAGEPRWSRNYSLRGVEHLPVTFTPRTFVEESR